MNELDWPRCPPGRLLLHQRRHQRRVDAAREEDTERDVRDHPQPHRIAQQLARRVERVCLGAAERPEHALRDLARIPVRLQLRAAGGHAQDRSRRELPRARVDRHRTRHPAELQVLGDRVLVETPVEVRQGRNRLQLRGEGKESLPLGVVERLDPGTVAHEEQRPLLPVPNREREHADEALHRPAHPPPFEARQHHLGVGVPAKRDVAQLVQQFAVVVDLTIEFDDVPAARRRHRLRAGRRQIDDLQAAEGERDSARVVDELAVVVRPAVANRRRHPADVVPNRVRRGSVSAPDP